MQTTRRHLTARPRKPQIIPEGQAWCSAGHLDDVSQFGVSKSRPDGRQPYCFEHNRIIQRRSYHVRTKPWILRKPIHEQEQALQEFAHRTPQVWVIDFGSNRAKWKLYGAALLVSAKILRSKKQYGPARILDAHYKTMCSEARDVSPRIVEIMYPHEWRVITKALRPTGSKPKPGSNAAKLYALYQWILRHYKIKDHTAV